MVQAQIHNTSCLFLFLFVCLFVFSQLSKAHQDTGTIVIAFFPSLSFPTGQVSYNSVLDFSLQYAKTEGEGLRAFITCV